MKALNKIFYLYIFISLTLCQGCPDNCVCENEEDEEMCTGCQTGYYDLDSGCNLACDKCPGKECDEQTGKCTNDGDCIGTSTFGDKCDQSCEESVTGCSQCHKDGTCFECSDKKKWGAQCTNTCENCPEQTCNFDGKCDVQSEFCGDSSYYGEMCTTPCKNNNREYCTKCKMANGVCSECSGSHYGDDCDRDCSKCPNGKCEMSGDCSTTSDSCGDSTYTGTKCDQKCSEVIPNCVNCLMVGSKCTQCEKSFFNEDCKGTCNNCPEGTCHMTGICTDPSTDCIGETMKGDYCNTPCNDPYAHCETCSRNGICKTCSENKYKGEYCEESCSYCPGGLCSTDGTCSDPSSNCEGETMKGTKCDTSCADPHTHCEKCSRDGTCTKCEENKYKGEDCETACPKCPGETCYINGNCTDPNSDCKDETMKGDKCETPCSDGHPNCESCSRNGICKTCTENKFKGDYCEESCSNCPGGTCYANGTCIDPSSNCDDETMKGDKCDTPCNNEHPNCEKCKRDGTCTKCFYDKFKENNCSIPCSNCPGGTCHINGTCIDPSSNCEGETMKGEKCDTSCGNPNEYCSTCKRDGTCLTCKDQLKYGPTCTDSCENCPGDICEFDDGTCINEGDCENFKFYEDKCQIPCTNISATCDTCYRNGTCKDCTDDLHYGEDCTDTCDKCPTPSCNMEGICSDTSSDCLDQETYGPKCEDACSKIGLNCTKCYRNETCSECINPNWYGPKCDQFCSHCPNNECKINGDCVDTSANCPDPRFYGNDCHTPCSDINETCSTCTRTGICTTCTSEEFWGDKCEKHCDYCPWNKCYINGTCIDQTENCIGNITFGIKCDEPCTDINENCLYCNRQKKCFECEDKSKFGDDCSIPCDRCPGEPSVCDNKGICRDQTTPCKDPSYTGNNCSVLCESLHSNCKECDRYEICTLCINRTSFGEACDESCERCPGNGFCNISGICDDQIKDCDNNEYTGANCSVLCSDIHDNCKECHRNNTCTLCNDRESFGETCEQSCKNCPGNGLCDINGICDNKKLDCDNISYTGDNCWVLCSDVHSNCKECHRNNTCTLCIDREFFGETCENPCDNCPGYCYHDGICENQIKNCDNDTFTGIKCDELCSKNVSNCLTCNRKNICSKCINRTKFGPDCNTSCGFCPGNQLCDINGNCDDQTSVCTDDHYTGANCSVLCSDVSNCSRCDRNQHCFECSDKTFYGQNCNDSCANCPGERDLCDINGICNDKTGLCKDDTLTGSSCNESCKDLYPNGYCKRCNREEKCTECSNKRFHGDNCSLGCEDCSDTGCNIQGYCHEFKCKNSTFGLGCEHPCTCESNSDDTDCGKFGGQCLSCKFGYYGKACQDRCYYKCQTELCCIFKKYSDDIIKTKLEITTNYKYIEIDINGTLGKFEIDYNYGYPLTIFNETTEFDPNCNANTIRNLSFNEPRKRDSYEQYFTNYFVNSSIFNGQVIKIQNKIIEGVDITVANNVKCYKNEDKNQISGIIGLGFFNSISNSYFSNKNLEIHELNILSYFLEGNNVQLYFGNMFKEQIDYVERLTSCDVILDSESDIQGKKMTCKLDGIKNAKYTEAFKLEDAFITFSLGEKSSLILGNNPNYENYLEKIYFKEDEYQIKYEDRNGTRIKYYLYDSETINKLPNFGFVFNKFYYTYSPDKFFKDESGGRKRFLIEINKNSSTTEFIIGKEFLEDIKFTINNEEAKIYFYAKNAEYSDKFTSEVNDNTFMLNLDAKESAAVSLSIIIFINLLAFSIFYCVKRRKMMNSGDYSRLE